MPFSRRNALRAFAAGTTGFAVAQPFQAAAEQSDQSGQTGQTRQRAFAAAAEEFGVPESVLLGVSYLKSRWDFHSGAPSTGAGFGPMHLTDVRSVAGSGGHHDHGTEDPRGDTARARLRPVPPTEATEIP